MDWFRWHHGTVTDRKWPRIASRAGTTVANVIAVWAAILESASQAESRGYAFLSDDDAEDLDASLGMPTDTTRKVIAELCARGMIDDENRLAAWDKRQPKREREDNSAERVRKFRERQAALSNAAQASSDPSSAEFGNVTPRNASVTEETPRGEEIREEEKKEKQSLSCASPTGDAPTRSDPIPYQQIVDAYNRTMQGLAKVRDMTNKRKTATRKVWTGRRQSPEFWVAYFAECQRDSFLNGTGPYRNGHENWRPDFDYLMREEVVVRTYERAISRMEHGNG